MDIGKEQETIIVEPVEDPFRPARRETPQVDPAVAPEREREPEKVPA